MEIGANKYQLWGKIIAIVVFASLLGIIINLAIHTSHIQPGKNNIYAAIGLAVLLVLMIGVLSLPLYYLTTGVYLDNATNEITLRYLLKKTETLSIEEISGYTTTRNYTKSTIYDGILLYRTDGRKVLLSDFNLSEHEPIVAFLKENNIPCNGAEKFAFFKYYIGQ